VHCIDTASFRLAELRKDPKPVRNGVTGVLHYTKNFVRWDKDTGEYTKLEYTASRWENSTIGLDDRLLGIDQIQCSQNWTNITFETSDHLSRLRKRLIIGTLLFSSYDWGCSSTPSGGAEHMFRAVADPSIVNDTTMDNQTTLAISTMNMLPFSFFGNASVSFYTNHSLMTSKQLRKVMKSAGISDAID
jgi:hypothetical protein